MIKKYSPQEWNKKPISDATLKECTGFGKELWLQFTGFLDCDLRCQFFGPDEVVLHGQFPVIKLDFPERLVRGGILRFEIDIDLSTQTIHNRDVYLLLRGEQHGLIAHVRQVVLAAIVGFKNIKLRAHGGIDDLTKRYNGHVTWAKYGYTMTETEEKRFLRKMKRDKKDYKTLIELIRNGNENYWVNHGYTWNGIFDLSESSDNIELLKQHLTLAGRREFLADQKILVRKFFERFTLL